jgi:hypothetical protein
MPDDSPFSPPRNAEYKQYSKVREDHDEKKSFKSYEDDIECVSWLQEINVIIFPR